MNLDTFMAIACLLGAALMYAGYRWCNEIVCLKYKEQKIGR